MIVKRGGVLLTSGSVAASVTQAQIHVIKYMASFVIFPGGLRGSGRCGVGQSPCREGSFTRAEVARGGERS
jgi:hypothetical protein